MEKIIKYYEKNYGYKPTIYEIENVYRSGCITLTDKEEDEILKALEKNNLN